MDIDVKKFANFAKINLKIEEETEIKKEISVILDYVDLLSEIDKKEQILDNITGMKNVFREDIPKKYKGDMNLVNNAPLTKDGFFLVPKVIQ